LVGAYALKQVCQFMFFPYFVYGAKPSAGEQLAGGERKMKN